VAKPMRPTKLRILGETWSVEYRNEDQDLDNRYMGTTQYRHRRIVLMEQDEQVMKRVFLHELIHILFDRITLQRNDEDNVVRAEFALWAIMKDNVPAFEWMMSE
jgi:hypothetical protein